MPCNTLRTHGLLACARRELQLRLTGDFAAARPLYERALSIREKALGPDHPSVAVSLNSLAILLMTTGDLAEARSRGQRAVEIYEKSLGPDHPALAVGLEALANVCSELGDYAAARPLYERSLAIREKALGPEHPDVASGLNNLALTLYKMGDYAAARPVYERAGAIWEKALGPDHPRVAMSFGNLAILLQETGDYEGSKALHERALAIRERSLGPEHLHVSDSLNGLGILLDVMGDYAAAKRAYERALAVCEKGLGPDHPRVASTLSNLAGLLSVVGDYSGARAMYERSLAIRERALGPDHPSVAISLNNLAILLDDMGDYAEAKILHERALAIREKVLGSEHQEVAKTLENLASLLWQMGDLARARSLHERALAIRKRALGPEHHEVGRSLDNLASLLHAMGDHAGANPLYEQALAVRIGALGLEHHEVARSLSNLAGLLLETGDLEQAEQLYERALAVWEKSLGPGHPEMAAGLQGLAGLLWETGRPARALDLALRAKEICAEHLRLTARTLAEREALRYAATRTSGLDLALSIVLAGFEDVPDAERRAWDGLVCSRALVLDEMAARHRSMVEATDPDISLLAGNRDSARQRLANLMVRGPGTVPSEHYRRLLDEARREMEAAERALAQMSVSYRKEQRDALPGLERILAALPSAGALVAYIRYDRYDLTVEPAAAGKGEASASRVLRQRDPVPSYLAFVFREGDRKPRAVHLGGADGIEALVSAWREEVDRGLSGGAEDSLHTAGTALRRRIWDPLAPHLQGAERVFVVPDGALHLVSLAALPTGEGAYLVEGVPLIHYLSAERDLVPSAMTVPEGEGLLALGDPAFEERSLFAALVPKEDEGEKDGLLARVAALIPFRGERSGCRDFGSLRFERLPATGWETRTIVRLWKRKDAVRRAGQEVFHLTRAGASEAAFKDQAPGRRVLHLATHGFFLGGRCESALESMRGISGTGPGPMQAPPPLTGENPLLLSGLALAGANHRNAAGPDEEDGILTAEEIAALDLSGVEWAVLSACDTGVGEIKAGEGVFGLRRAFEVAGVDTLIMSLWSVEDEATREWMRNLYEARFVEGRDTAESVREASLRVLKRRREAGESTHPFYWAAFVAAGEWR